MKNTVIEKKWNFDYLLWGNYEYLELERGNSTHHSKMLILHIEPIGSLNHIRNKTTEYNKKK